MPRRAGYPYDKGKEFHIYTLCIPCGYHIACEELALEESTEHAWSWTNCVCCGKRFNPSETRFLSTSERTTLTREQVLRLLDSCRRNHHTKGGQDVLADY